MEDGSYVDEQKFSGLNKSLYYIRGTVRLLMYGISIFLTAIFLGISFWLACYVNSKLGGGYGVSILYE